MKHMKILTFSFLVLAGGLFVACDNEDEQSSQVELLSFGPVGVEHGDEIVFIGNNLKKVTAIELPGVMVDKAQFTNQTDDKITLVVPDEATEGHVTLKTADGDIVSKSILDFKVIVTIETMTEEVKPGTNLTITGEYLNWVHEVWFAEGILVTEFVSQSLNELVVTVPMEAITGRISLITGGTEPLEVKSEEALIITLPVITELSPNPVARESDLTITGTDLDLTAGVLFKGITTPITSFVSKSETELVITVPGEANKGDVTLITYSGQEVLSPEPLAIVGDLPPLAPLAYALYVDAIENGWGNWGWGGPADFSNTENVRDGAKAIKKTYDGSWDALRFHGGPVTTAGYSEIAFSIFGTPGTGGLQLNVIANEQWGSPHIITIVEGEWTEYKLTKANFGNPTEINDFLFQGRGWSGTLYVDHVGFR